MAYKNLFKKPVPQAEPLDARQVKNDAGGYVYAVDSWTQLDRFLILGAAEGTYYASPSVHAKRSEVAVRACLALDGERTVRRVIDVSVKGLAVKQDHAIFALALAVTHGDPVAKSLALDAVSTVCRTGSTFFQFLDELKALRTLTGRSIKRAVGNWYVREDQDWLAYQLVKYRSRNGWTHRDALRVGHPKNESPLLRWAVKGEFEAGSVVPSVIEGFLRAQAAPDAESCAAVVREFRLPREAVPTEFLNSPEVWEALLERMPLTAMIRNLGNMSKVGLLTPQSDAARMVVAALADMGRLRHSRVHPMSVLAARRVYEVGHGVKGAGAWSPVPEVVSALDEAFYLAYGNIVPTGKRLLVALDVSGSMNFNRAPGSLRASEIAAAMAMVWLATEDRVEVMGFADTFRDLGLHRRMSLTEALARTSCLTFGATDCSLPAQWAHGAGRDVDAFVVITDNETWFGKMHPSEALRRYRAARVPDARQIVLATAAMNGSIADPSDPLSLDISGFSSDVPQAVATFLGSQPTEEMGAGD